MRNEKGEIRKGEMEMQLLKNIEGAKEKIEAIYQDLDILKGYLGEIKEEIGYDDADEITVAFYSEWLRFPTSHTLDTLYNLLDELKARYEDTKE